MHLLHHMYHHMTDSNASQKSLNREHSVEVIHLDVLRTFPTLGFFQEVMAPPTPPQPWNPTRQCLREKGNILTTLTSSHVPLLLRCLACRVFLLKNLVEVIIPTTYHHNIIVQSSLSSLHSSIVYGYSLIMLYVYLLLRVVLTTKVCTMFWVPMLATDLTLATYRACHSWQLYYFSTWMQLMRSFVWLIS